MRTAKISRKTKETDIKISLTLDGKGKYKIKTPIGFLSLLQSTGFLTLKCM